MRTPPTPQGVHASPAPPWRVSGTYFEACNCEAVCPCRRQGGRPGSESSTYGICQFALSWQVGDGHYGPLPLAGLSVVLTGWYSDDEPDSPWRVILYVDERGSAEQQAALTDIFLGSAGGTPMRNYTHMFGDILSVRPSRIALDHAPGRQQIGAGDWVTVRVAEPVPAGESITCAVPGHDHVGQELRVEVLRVQDGPLSWEVRGRCGFATDFDYGESTAGIMAAPLR